MQPHCEVAPIPAGIAGSHRRTPLNGDAANLVPSGRSSQGAQRLNRSASPGRSARRSAPGNRSNNNWPGRRRIGSLALRQLSARANQASLPLMAPGRGGQKAAGCADLTQSLTVPPMGGPPGKPLKSLAGILPPSPDSA